MNSTTHILLGPDEGASVELGPLGCRFMVDADRSDGGFALVEHPIAPRGLAAPMHVHEREDEYSYVLEGEVGFQVEDEVVIARPGSLVFKPRGRWHAFWNAGDAPARLLEIISPAGFERYFGELQPLMEGEPDIEGIVALQQRYGMRMDPESIGRLTAEHGLVTPGPPPAE
jgi:mannose-6-phosphate isomerase-like protein (cupin superfamily)